MATSQDYIEFVCEQIKGAWDVRYRKMFGEYMVYVQDKPILLVCESTVYVKKLAVLEEKMKDAPCGIPYKSAKEHYILDIEDGELCEEIIPILVENTPLPKPKKKKPKADV